MSELAQPEPAAQSPQERLRQMLAEVARTCELPPLPAVATAALNLARDPKATVESLARVVQADAALAARVLRMSRSAIYARRSVPQTLQHAIVTVGFHELRKVLIAASARTLYDDDEAAEALWSHALAAAFAADEIGRRWKCDRAWTFVAGLLHDIGKTVLHRSDPHLFRRTCEHAAEVGIPSRVAEAEAYGVDHAMVGASLVSQWGLDSELAQGILFHHPRSGDDLVTSPLPEVVRAADWVAYRIGAGAPCAPPPEPTESIPQPEADDLCERVREAYEEERALFA